MSNNNNVANAGISPAFLLFLVFLVLKLTGVIAWSWWLVTAPLWGIFALIAVILMIGLAVAVVSSLFNNR